MAWTKQQLHYIASGVRQTQRDTDGVDACVALQKFFQVYGLWSQRQICRAVDSVLIALPRPGAIRAMASFCNMIDLELVWIEDQPRKMLARPKEED